MTERASFDQAYASSLVRRDPPMMATEPGPDVSMLVRIAVAAALSAAPHEVPTSC